jgi:hypothetical protein
MGAFFSNAIHCCYSATDPERDACHENGYVNSIFLPEDLQGAYFMMWIL